MKQIQPISIWVNGQQQTANQFNLRIVADNLSDTATFYFELINQTIVPGSSPINTVLASGNSVLQGQDYTNWNANPDINTNAYTRIAAKLNLTLI